MANHHLRVYDEVLEMLSDEENPTPLVRLRRVVPLAQAKVYAKLEWYNPFGAVKDRIAANMVKDAEGEGHGDGGGHPQQEAKATPSFESYYERQVLLPTEEEWASVSGMSL